MSLTDEQISRRAIEEFHLRVSSSAKAEPMAPIKTTATGNYVVALKCTQGAVSYEVEVELTKTGKFVDLRVK